MIIPVETYRMHDTTITVCRNLASRLAERERAMLFAFLSLPSSV